LGGLGLKNFSKKFAKCDVNVTGIRYNRTTAKAANDEMKEFIMNTKDYAWALLPTNTRMDMLVPTKATYYSDGQVAYVVEDIENPKKKRVLTSFNGVMESWAVGTVHDIRHDQHHYRLGTYRVVAIVDFRNGDTMGPVPYGRQLPHWVFK
jgi:hypothetical protein